MRQCLAAAVALVAISAAPVHSPSNARNRVGSPELNPSPVEIVLDSLIEGARRARGTVVIIDVFRAFTTAAVALARGAAAIILVAEPHEALKLRNEGIGALCMGEVNGERPPGFDFGNSPFELSRAEVNGRTLIQSTRAGTVGVCAVAPDRPIYVASFLVAGATARLLRDLAPPRVTIVAMGARGVVRSDEDELCALYLRNRILGKAPDRDAVRALVIAGADADKFGDPELPHFHPRDRDMALDIDAMDFAIEVTREDGQVLARRRAVDTP